MTNKINKDQSPIDYIMNELCAVKETAERLDKKVFGGDTPEKGIAAIVAGVQSVKNLIWANLLLIVCGFFFVGSWYTQINRALTDIIGLKINDKTQDSAIVLISSDIKSLKEDVRELKQQHKGN